MIGLRRAGGRVPGSAIHEKILRDLALLRVKFEHGTLQDAITIDAARVHGEGPPHLLYAPALVNVSVHDLQDFDSEFRAKVDAGVEEASKNKDAFKQGAVTSAK